MATFTSVQDGNLTDPRTWGGVADASFFAQDVGIVDGVLNSTNLDLVRRADGQKAIVTEQAGQSWRVWYDYPVPASMVQVHVHVKGHYAGNPAHVVKPEIYNWNASTWRTLNATFESIATDLVYHVVSSVLGSEISGGVMRVSIYHQSSGSVGHFMYIDNLEIHSEDPRPGGKTIHRFEDDLNVGHNVIVNTATNYRFQDVTVTSGGILEWPTDRSTEFGITASGGLTINSGGTLRIGYPATPVEVDKIHNIYFYGISGVSGNQFLGAAGHTSQVHGHPDYPGLRKTTLATYWNTGRTITVNGDASTWQAGQRLVTSVGRKDRYGHYSLDYPNNLIASVGAYNAGNNTTEVTLGSTLDDKQTVSATHFGDAEIWNLNRNVRLDLLTYPKYQGAWGSGGSYVNHLVQTTVWTKLPRVNAWNNCELFGFFHHFNTSHGVEIDGTVVWGARHIFYNAYGCVMRNSIIYNKQETTYGSNIYHSVDMMGCHSHDYQGRHNEHYDCNLFGMWYGIRTPTRGRYERCTFQNGNLFIQTPSGTTFIDCTARVFAGPYTNNAAVADFEGCAIDAPSVSPENNWNLQYSTNQHAYTSMYFTNCTLGTKFYPYRTFQRASMSDALYSTHGQWETPPSQNSWIIKMETASFIMQDGWENRLFKDGSFAYANTEDTAVTYRIRPENFTTPLNASNVWAEARYTTNYMLVASSIDRERTQSPAATYANATWHNVTVPIAPGMAGPLFHNLLYRFWEPGAYILIDPVVTIT